MIRSTIYIAASRERVFSTLTEYARYPEWTPGCEECTIRSSNGATTTVDMVMNGPRRLRLGIRYDAAPHQLVQFEMVSGKDLNRYSGLYRLVTAEDGKGTVVFAELDLDVPAVPRFLIEGMVRKSMGQAAHALKRYVERLPGLSEPIAPREPAGGAPRKAPRRVRRVMQIVKGPGGYRVWFMGSAFTVKKIDGNVFDT